MLPHFHISGIHATITFLMIVAVFGSLHLLAASYPENTMSKAWIGGLGF